MTSKPPLPPASDEPSQPPPAAPSFLNRPEFKPVATVKKPHRVVLLLVPLLVLVLIAGAGYGSYRVSMARYTTNAATVTAPAQTKATDPYAGWRTYTSPTEKVTFLYPPTWTVNNQIRAYTPTADAAEFTSPSKNVSVVWVSQISGIGGACDSTVMPGSAAAATDSLGACPYFKVTDKQKLTGADLYYVAGTMTHDGKHFSPWMALQDEHGILSDQGSPGYLIFQGSFNTIIESGKSYGMGGVKLLGGEADLPPLGDGSKLGFSTEAQAAQFFTTTEAQQAKLILLSLKYTADPTASWYAYTSASNHYTLRIPDGWNLIQNCGGPMDTPVVYSNGGNNTLAINQGTKATVTDECFGKDGNPLLSLTWYDFGNPSEDAQKLLDSFTTNVNLQKQASFQTNAGQTVDKYYMHVTTPPQTIDQPQVGTYYEYVIKNSKGFVWVFNFYGPGDTDYHTYVEKALKTLQLNS